MAFVKEIAFHLFVMVTGRPGDDEMVKFCTAWLKLNFLEEHNFEQKLNFELIFIFAQN